MTSPPIPAEPSSMTDAWFSAVLGTEVRVQDHEPVGTGLMGSSHRFRLESAGEAPGSVVVKSPSTEAAVRELGATAYRREVGFYRDVAHTIDAAVPHCHHASIDESGQTFALVLEDLAPAEQGNQMAGCSVQEAAEALTTMARVHASTWDAAHVADLPWLDDGGGGDSLVGYMTVALAAFRERFETRLDPATWPVLEAFAAHSAGWTATEPPSRAVLHGDFRLDNLLFRPGGEPAWIVDWQTVSYACPARDLAYFLGNSLTVDDRRAHERALVDLYCGVLADAGVVYSAEQAWSEMRHGAFQGPLVTMLGAFAAARTERSEEMFTAMADRCAVFITDHGALDVLG